MITEIFLSFSIIALAYLIFDHVRIIKRSKALETEISYVIRENDRIMKSENHEIRNYIHALTGSIELALRLRDYNHLFNTYTIALITKNSIMNILQSKSVVKVELAETNPVNFFNKHSILFENMCRRKNVEFRYNMAQTITDMKMDKNKISQVLLNIVSNALRYTESGGCITQTVEGLMCITESDSLSEGQSNVEENMNKHKFEKKPSFLRLSSLDTSSVDMVEYKWMRITIKDTGRGMPIEQVSRLNKISREEFGKQSEYKDSKSGLGIGMWISSIIIKEHSGVLDIQSEQGKGTTVIIHLPIERCDLMRGSEDVFVQKQSSGLSSLLKVRNDLRIALVDDDLFSLEHLENSCKLEKTYNIKSTKFYNPSVLLKSLTDSQFYDIIISDYNLPSMNGLELVSRIRELCLERSWTQPKYIILTADTNLSVKDPYVKLYYKPLSMKEIQNMIKDSR